MSANMKIVIFIAEGFEFGTQHLETEEVGLNSRKIAVDGFEKMIIDGLIQDSVSVTAFLPAKLKGYI
jgi:hypothetical protein